jgi:hypothetical protein
MNIQHPLGFDASAGALPPHFLRIREEARRNTEARRRMDSGSHISSYIITVFNLLQVKM